MRETDGLTPIPAAWRRAGRLALIAPLAIALALVGCAPEEAVEETAPAPATAEAVALPDAVAERVPEGWRHRKIRVAASSAGLVATDAPLATEVGVEVLDGGGNATDAAVATAFALAVVLPTAGNIGGGGFLVSRRADGEATALDFRERAPMEATRDMFLDDEGELTRLSVTGHLAAGVPGSVAGLWEAHQRHGSLEWAELVEPAIRLAEDGFVVSDDLAASVERSAERLARFPGSAALFLPDGEPLRAGEVWRNPDLAAALGRIAEDGPAGFYRGETAELIVAEMERGGGLIGQDDLAGYEAVWREPVEFDYRGHRVISMPPPSSGGLTVALIANIVEGWDLAELGWHSPEAIHVAGEAMRRAFADRNHFLGDPDFVDNPREMFLSEEYAAELREGIDMSAATPSSEVSRPTGDDGRESRHTTHFSVVDGAGNAVALTTTLNTGFGSAVTVAGAGFLLNNEMDDFAAKPGTENVYELVQGEPNAVEPGKRMLSSMTPTIVVRDGATLLVTGASGGPTIITGVFQVISNVVDFGLQVGPAVAAPRFHHQHLPDQLRYEEDGFLEARLSALRERGHEIGASPWRIAVAASILRDGDRWTGVADPREAGLAAGVAERR